MPKHTPTSEQIIAAVAAVFRTVPEKIRSSSRAMPEVEAREVVMMLMRFRGAMDVPEIAIELEYKKRLIYSSIDRTISRIRVDADFSARITEAERTLLNPTPCKTK